MIIDKQKFLVACAKAKLTCTAVVVKKARLSSYILTKIKQGKNLNTVTIGKLAEALNVPVEELVVFEKD